MRWLIASERVILADDARAEMLSSVEHGGQISSRSILPTGMPVQPEITSPTMLRVHADPDQRRFALQRAPSSADSARRELGVGTRPVASTRRRSAAAAGAAPLLELLADRRGSSPTSSALLLPARRELGETRPRSPYAPLRDLAPAARAWSAPSARSRAPSTRACTARSSSAPLGVLDRRRRRALAQRQPRARRIEHADRLVRQLAVGQVAMRQPHRRVQPFVQNPHVVMLLERRDDAAQHQQALLLRSALRP